MTQFSKPLFRLVPIRWRDVRTTYGVTANHLFDCYAVGVCDFNAATAVRKYYNE